LNITSGFTIAAYDISKATLYRWRKRLDKSGGKLTSLITYSRSPKNKRRIIVDPRIISYIRILRTNHPYLGKEKIKPLLDKIFTQHKLNGLEFLGLFNQYLEQKQIKHLFIYPRYPKINSFIERANRSLKEELVNYHLQTLQVSLQEFNQKLIEYLIWYNTARVSYVCNSYISLTKEKFVL